MPVRQSQMSNDPDERPVASDEIVAHPSGLPRDPTPTDAVTETGFSGVAHQQQLVQQHIRDGKLDLAQHMLSEFQDADAATGWPALQLRWEKAKALEQFDLAVEAMKAGDLEESALRFAEVRTLDESVAGLASMEQQLLASQALEQELTTARGLAEQGLFTEALSAIESNTNEAHETWLQQRRETREDLLALQQLHQDAEGHVLNGAFDLARNLYTEALAVWPNQASQEGLTLLPLAERFATAMQNEQLAIAETIIAEMDSLPTLTSVKSSMSHQLLLARQLTLMYASLQKNDLEAAKQLRGQIAELSPGHSELSTIDALIRQRTILVQDHRCFA